MRAVDVSSESKKDSVFCPQRLCPAALLFVALLDQGTIYSAEADAEILTHPRCIYRKFYSWTLYARLLVIPRK